MNTINNKEYKTMEREEIIEVLMGVRAVCVKLIENINICEKDPAQVKAEDIFSGYADLKSHIGDLYNYINIEGNTNTTNKFYEDIFVLIVKEFNNSCNLNSDCKDLEEYFSSLYDINYAVRCNLGPLL